MSCLLGNEQQGYRRGREISRPLGETKTTRLIGEGAIMITAGEETRSRTERIVSTVP